MQTAYGEPIMKRDVTGIRDVIEATSRTAIDTELALNQVVDRLRGPQVPTPAPPSGKQLEPPSVQELTAQLQMIVERTNQIAHELLRLI